MGTGFHAVAGLLSLAGLVMSSSISPPPLTPPGSDRRHQQIGLHVANLVLAVPFVVFTDALSRFPRKHQVCEIDAFEIAALPAGSALVLTDIRARQKPPICHCIGMKR
ncbi:MAG: hypothetical protein IT428_25065 [Planctomycetaceae bacterium]|nr:hypothetical protein [Planctomycetaceae bacterium]